MQKKSIGMVQGCPIFKWNSPKCQQVVGENETTENGQNLLKPGVETFISLKSIIIHPDVPEIFQKFQWQSL